MIHLCIVGLPLARPGLCVILSEAKSLRGKQETDSSLARHGESPLETLLPQNDNLSPEYDCAALSETLWTGLKPCLYSSFDSLPDNLPGFMTPLPQNPFVAHPARDLPLVQVLHQGQGVLAAGLE